jgi:excisionase family DNA binding protein
MAKKVSKEVDNKEKKEVAYVPPIFPQVDVYTLKYIEKVWNITDRYLREAIKDGSLKAYKVGKPYFVTHSDLIEYITKVKVNPKEVKVA